MICFISVLEFSCFEWFDMIGVSDCIVEIIVIEDECCKFVV